MRKGFFAYPWDLLDEGMERALNTMAERCYCNAIALNASYHSGRILRPRQPGPKVYDRPGSTVAFRPRPELYREGAPLPVVEERVAQARVLEQARRWCEQKQMDFGVWVVGLHNSSLGSAHPELCMRNCFGDIYSYLLCPSKPPVRAYLRGLIRDICEQFRPERILLETASYLGLRHWVHHELFLAPIGEAEEMLLFLCFCPECLERAAAAGVDGEAARKQAAEWAEVLLRDERGALSPSFTIADMPALLVESPALYAYIQVRVETTATLVAEVHEVTADLGVQLEVMPSVFGRPVSRAFREGMALRRLAQVSDALLPLSYFSDPRETRADLRWCKMLSGNAPMSVGLTACYPITTSAEGLAANARVCAAEGALGVYYYNYGMLSEERLDWVAEANAGIG